MVARKGNDGNIYFPVKNRKTNKVEYINPIQMSQSVVAFPTPRRLFTDVEESSEINTPHPQQQGASQYLNF